MPTQWWQPAEHYVAPCDVHRVVGARLHALRLEAEITVRELGAASGIHPQRVRYYESGGVITLPILGRLAHALGLDLVDLAWDLRHPPPPPRFRRPRTTPREKPTEAPRRSDQAAGIAARSIAAARCPRAAAAAGGGGGLAARADR